MKKTLIIFISVLLLLFIYSCDNSNSILNSNQNDTDASALAKKPTAVEINYSVEMTDCTYDEVHNQTTFVYDVTSNPLGGPSISHWMILFQDEFEDFVELVDASENRIEYGKDGSTGFYGLKFDKGYHDQETRTLSFTLAGRWLAGPVEIVVKAGNGYALGLTFGPLFYLGEIPPPPIPA